MAWTKRGVKLFEKTIDISHFLANPAAQNLKYKWVSSLRQFSRFWGENTRLHFPAIRERRMRNRLQYMYSIIVFVGVLITAYMMMNQTNGGLPQIFQKPVYRNEATVLDPAVNELFEMEKALSEIEEDESLEEEVPE